jgi:hypothetical protein
MNEPLAENRKNWRKTDDCDRAFLSGRAGSVGPATLWAIFRSECSLNQSVAMRSVNEWSEMS